MKKIWYEIILVCRKLPENRLMKVGEFELIARVKSFGLAYQIKEMFKKTYPEPTYTLNIK